MPSAYSKTDLFGGAITVDLPSNYADVSTIRQVPDHQEVFLNREGFGSIVIDILERTEPPEHPCNTDEEALEYHYKDIVAEGFNRQREGHLSSDTEEETKVWASGRAAISSFSPATPIYTMLATQHPPHQTSRSGQAVPDFTSIMLTLIRLEAQKTDVLIAINSPHMPGHYATADVDLAGGRLGPYINEDRQHRDKIHATFKMNDWNLFGS